MTSPELRSPPSDSGTPREEPRRLTRSREDRVIAGVAGGLARYFSIDPVIVRIAFVLFAITGGGGIIAYLIAWIAIPEASDDEPRPVGTATGSARLLGIVLIAFGALVLVDRLVPALTWFSWRYVAPAALVAIGLLLLLRKETP